MVEEVGPKRKVSVKETIDAVYPWMESKVRRTLSAKNVIKRFPILNWLPKYSTTDALGDLVAGITVGLTVVPQSLAYASIAGVPPQVRVKLAKYCQRFLNFQYYRYRYSLNFLYVVWIIRIFFRSLYVHISGKL